MRKDRYENAMRYREQLIRMVKAMGEEVINRAYDLVGNSGGITNMEIILTFEQNEFPELTVKRSHASEECVRVMMEEVEE